MAQKRRKSIETATYGDPEITTKRWLRKVIQQAINFWAPIMNLEAYVDQITFYIAEPDDQEIGEGAGACISTDSTRRSTDLRIKRNVVELMAGEYIGTTLASEILEMTIIHELVHIWTHPMSQWAGSTIDNLRNGSILESLFTQQEEICVEHISRALVRLKTLMAGGNRRFPGVIKYLAKDPHEKG